MDGHLLRLLLVEDNPGDARLVEELLRETTGQAPTLVHERLLAGGLDRLRDDPAFDALLLDLSLPDSQGLATLQRAHAASPGVPIVVLTGLGDDRLGLAALQGGAQDYLVKGAHDGAALLRSVRYAMERQRAAERARELDRLREAERLRAQFVNSVAHELGTPLTPIRLQLHMLASGALGALNPRQRRSVEIVDRNVDRLTALVQDILDAARLQSSRLRLAVRPVDVSELAREVVESFREPAVQAGLRLELRDEPGLTVTADPGRVVQVLQNLLNNAWRFTPPGGVITVRTARGPDGALVSVHDTGAGLHGDDLGRLFQPFTQLHRPERAVDPGGTGLGLYISRGIVELHGGRIWASSPGPGQGATFAFLLPYEPPPGSAAWPPSLGAAPAAVPAPPAAGALPPAAASASSAPPAPR